MNDPATEVSRWLRSVLDELPAKIRALYVEFGDAYTTKMVHLVCFNAFGFETLANGCFDRPTRITSASWANLPGSQKAIVVLKQMSIQKLIGCPC